MGEIVSKEKKATEVINGSANEGAQELQNQNQQIQNQNQQMQNQNQQMQNQQNAEIIPVVANAVNITENKQENIVLLENTLRTVNSHMPPQLNANVNKKVKVEYRTALPKDMVALLDEIAGWEKVKQETSVPVKQAAEKLKKAKNDVDAANAMTDLAVACAHYMEINGLRRFKSKRRKQVVTDLMSKITGFIPNADLIYYNRFEIKVNQLRGDAADGKLEARFNTFEADLKASVISANGATTVEKAKEIMGERTLLRREAAEREAKRLAGFSDLSDEEKAQLDPYTEADRNTLYEKLKDQKKDMTEEQFKLYVKATATDTLTACPDYNKIYSKAVSRLKAYGAKGTFSRDVLVALRPVNFDKGWRPMTKEDKANHEWNLKFLRAFENDDYETREEMIAEEFPHTYDKVEYPRLPLDKMKKYMAAKKKAADLKKNKNAGNNAEKEKLKNEIQELKNEIQKVLNDWIDDFIRNGDTDSLFLASKKKLSFDAMKRVHISLADFWNSNPLLVKKSEALSQLTNYMLNYTGRNLGVCIGGSDVTLKYYEDTEEGKTKAATYLATTKELMDDLLDEIVSSMLKIDELKNEGIKPYVKCQDIEGEKQRLAELYRPQQEKEERERLAAEQKKREEEEKKQAEEAAKEKAKREAEEKAKREAEEKKAKAEAEEKREREELVPKIKETVEKLNANTAFGTKKELEKILKSELTKDQQKKIKANTKVDLVPNLTVKVKKKNADKLTKAVDAVTDMKIRLRKAVPIEIKKNVDYASFSNLSDVAAMFGDEKKAAEMLKNLTGVFGESKRLADNVKRFDCKDEDRDKAGFYALDVLTAEMMKLDVTSYDVRSDKAIAKNAAALEKMARGVEAYRKLVDTLGGEAYFEHLKNRNGELFQKVFNHIGRLTVLSNYYRVKKAMMEDEYYIESEEPISNVYAEKNKDIFEIDRLKRLQNMAEKYSMNLYIAHEKDDKYEPREFVTFLNEQERAICKIEQERYMVAPKWMYNALSLTEQKKQNDDPDAAFILNQQDGGDVYYMHKVVPEREKNAKTYNAVMKVQKNQIGKTFSGYSHFLGGKDDYLKSIIVSDNMNRDQIQHGFVLNYRRTTEEMREMLELLNIQNTEYWNTVKDDPKAVAYYESAFKEMAMRDIEAHYGCSKRVANTVGLKMLVMHPADLAMQYSLRLKLQIMGAFSSSNIDGKSNMEYVKKLFAENNKDGRFLFDAKDFSALTGFTSTVSWKLGNSGSLIFKVAKGEDKFDESDTDNVSYGEAEKKLLGKAGISDKISQKRGELQNNLNTLKEKSNNLLATLNKKGLKAAEPDKQNATEEEIKAIAKELSDTANEIMDIEKEIEFIDKSGDAYYWLSKHPERYSQKTFLAKGSNGKFIFGKQYRRNGRFTYQNCAEEIKDILDNDVLKPLDEEELKTYEASLKKRHMPAYMIEGDIYGIDLYRKKMDALIERDDQGNIVKENGKDKLKPMDSLPLIDSVTGKPSEDLD